MKENNDNYDFLSNEDFEQWENDFPKLPKTEVSFPDKHKLYKFEKRKKPQWAWYAAAACFVLGMFVFLPRIEREDAVLIAEVVERHDVIPAQAGNESSTQSIPQQPTVPPIQGDPRLRGDDGYGRGEHVGSPLQEIATIQSITNIQIPIEMNLAENRQILRFAQDDNMEISDGNNEQFFRFIRDDNRQERLELALNDFVITPAKTVIHTIARRFFERRTEVELFLEEQEFPRFFARHRDENMQGL